MAPRVFTSFIANRCLIGNFAAGQYINRNLRFGNYEIQFYAKPGSEGRINGYAEMMGQVLEFYSKQYGAPLFGTRLVVAQIDDESLDTYSGSGIIFLASKTVRLFAAHPGREARARSGLSMVGPDGRLEVV